MFTDQLRRGKRICFKEETSIKEVFVVLTLDAFLRFVIEKAKKDLGFKFSLHSVISYVTIKSNWGVFIHL